MVTKQTSFVAVGITILSVVLTPTTLHQSFHSMIRQRLPNTSSINNNNSNSTAVASAVSLGTGHFGSVAVPITAVEESPVIGMNSGEVVVKFSPEVYKRSNSGNSVASTASCSDDGSDDGLELIGCWSALSIDKAAELWKLSPQQRADLPQLGHRLRDIDHFKNNPLNAVRFLRARAWDLDAAEAMFNA